MGSAYDVLADIWSLTNLPAELLAGVDLRGSDPVLPSSFRVGTAAQVSIAAVACAANTIWQARTGHVQQITVDMRHAAAEFRSERYLRINGGPTPALWDAIAGAYRCKDGRWVRIHTNFPHHRDGILRLLGCAYDREAVGRALSTWEADTFEATAAEAGLVAVMLRSFQEWDAHPQGRAVAELPLLTISKIGDAPPIPLPGKATRPLSDIRVLDLTRVIAGPVSGRVLAAHGAEVLAISAAHLPSMEPTVMDTGRGKRSAFADLRSAAGRQALADLLKTADIFVQSYRPGALAARGFGPDAAANLRPGIIYVSLSAYGHIGPWASRRGFDSIVQTACGLNHAEALAAGTPEPRPLPCQALDHSAGYLMALGALAALLRRATEGGSWHVQVSLAQASYWLRRLGRVEDGFACADPAFEDVTDLLEETPSGWGRMDAVRHAAQMSETPPRWVLPSVPLGSHPPTWNVG
ncbi:MAG TPA: CoA transferase [Ktedonobacterales bacterium]|nr:CoA transferase [Ktedonobacterales bacterium]